MCQITGQWQFYPNYY